MRHKRQAQTFKVVLAHDWTKFRIQVLVSFGLLLSVTYVTFGCLHILRFLFASIFQLFLEIRHSSESFVSIAFNWFVPYFVRVGSEIDRFRDLTSLVSQVASASSRSVRLLHASIINLSNVDWVIYWDIHHWVSLETSLLLTLQSAIIPDLGKWWCPHWILDLANCPCPVLLHHKQIDWVKRLS